MSSSNVRPSTPVHPSEQRKNSMKHAIDNEIKCSLYENVYSTTCNLYQHFYKNHSGPVGQSNDESMREAKAASQIEKNLLGIALNTYADTK